jgi:hypothetical protein
MGICLINKSQKKNKIIKTVTNRTVKTFKVKMLFSKCSNNQHFKEGKTSLREKDF